MYHLILRVKLDYLELGVLILIDIILVQLDFIETQRCILFLQVRHLEFRSLVK